MGCAFWYTGSGLVSRIDGNFYRHYQGEYSPPRCKCTNYRLRRADLDLTCLHDVNSQKTSPVTPYMVLSTGHTVPRRTSYKRDLGVSRVDIAVLHGRECGISFSTALQVGHTIPHIISSSNLSSIHYGTLPCLSTFSLCVPRYGRLTYRNANRQSKELYLEIMASPRSSVLRRAGLRL